MSKLTLTFVQSEAARRYSRDAERSLCLNDTGKRLDAVQALELARRKLSGRERAIMDLVAVRGRSLAALSAASGQPVEELHRLFTQTANDLATHYETEDAA